MNTNFMHLLRPTALTLVLPNALLAAAIVESTVAQTTNVSRVVVGQPLVVGAQLAVVQNEEAEGDAQSSSNSSMHYHTMSDRGEFELRVDNGEIVFARINGKDVGASRVRRVSEGWQFLGEDGRVLETVRDTQQGASAGSSAAGSSNSSGGKRAAKSSTKSSSSVGGSSGGTSDGPSWEGSGGTSGASSGASSGSSSGASSSGSSNGTSKGTTSRSSSSSTSRSKDGPKDGPRNRSGDSVVGPAFGSTSGATTASPNGAPMRVQGLDAEPAPRSMIGAGLGTIDEALAHHLALDPARVTLVTNVIDGLPASSAGIERFDVIVGVNGSDNASPKKLRGLMANAEPGTKLALKVRRGAETRDVELAVEAFDMEKLSAIEVEGVEIGALPGGDVVPGTAMTFDLRGGDEGDTMIFVGPDGVRRELRMPTMPQLPAMQGAMGMDPADIERLVEEAMRQMEQRLDEARNRMGAARDANASSDAAQGSEERSADEIRRADEARRAAERARDAADDRMRRLEEQMERLMRELEREREDRKRSKPGSEA
jgi:hypothetical protein